MPDNDVPRIMNEKTTETGCRVRVIAYREGEYTSIEGVYLDLRVTGEADERRAELRMTAEEALWLAEALVGRAGEIRSRDLRPKETAEIERLTAELATARTAWDEWKASSRAGHAHASDMAAEVERLRAGIAHARWVAEVNENNDTQTLHALLDDIADLLNPPTEGDRP